MDTYSENQERHVLIINTGNRRAYALEAAAYSIGRDTTNAIVLDFDTVSRQHALLLRVPNPNSKRYSYRIIDGNTDGKVSANGIYINGKPVKSQSLNNGDTVEFGQHVKAAYLTLSMGEAEFVNYLESISYQSLKRELVDSKATIVGEVGEDEMYLDTPTQIVASTKKKEASVQVDGGRKDSRWQQTMHDSEKVARAIKISNPSPFRLWMAIATGGAAMAIAGGALMLSRQVAPSDAPPAASSSLVRPDSAQPQK
ncbi:MAG: FHA domain-containing protein [Cyanobacteria bacterium P01_F01_bin.42]